MNALHISVMVLANGHVSPLRQSIESALAQTVPPREILVVDDRYSPATDGFVRWLADVRVRYLAAEARDGARDGVGAGTEAARGDAIAILEPGVTFHPEKLAAHSRFLMAHPGVEFTYNDRFETDSTGNTSHYRQAPRTIGFAELFDGLSLMASDVVLRRECAQRVLAGCGVPWNEPTGPHLLLRLLLKRCANANVGRALNVRCRQGGLPDQTVLGIEALQALFADPACPVDVGCLQERALGRAHLILSLHALLAGDVPRGQALLRQSIRLDRSLLDLQARGFCDALLEVVLDDGADHVEPLRRVFAGLPEELVWVRRLQNRANARGHTEKGIRALLWGDRDEGRAHLASAAALGGHWERADWYRLLQRLDQHETEHGTQATRSLIAPLMDGLALIAPAGQCRWFKGIYFANHALRHSRTGSDEAVTGDVWRAIASSPGNVVNRGLWAVLARAWLQRAGIRVGAPPVSPAPSA